MVASLLLLLAGACTPGVSSDTASDPGTDSQPSDPIDIAMDDPVQALRDGAWSHGWPEHNADDTWTFLSPTCASVTGDFNDWTPQPMQSGANFCWLTVSIPSPAGARYKFTDGADYWADPAARSYTYDENGEISLVMPDGAAHIERWPALSGHGLAPRDVRVWVPEGPGPWSVLYAADGQNLFDPAGPWGGWHLGEALARSAPHVLVVGVDNTVDRLEEYGPGEEVRDGVAMHGHAQDWAALVTVDLRAHIDNTYPTSGKNGLMGSSMGGLVSLTTADLYPTQYDFVAALSPSLWWGHLGFDSPGQHGPWIDAGPRNITLYLDSGGSDGGDGCSDPDGDGYPEDDPNQADGYCNTRQLADALSAAGYTWDVDLFHWYDAGAEHNEAAWAARVDRPLAIFAGQ